MLWSMRSQTVGPDLATEQQQFSLMPLSMMLSVGFFFFKKRSFQVEEVPLCSSYSKSFSSYNHE